MTTSTSTSSSLSGSTSGTPALNGTTTYWSQFEFDPNATAASNFTSPANSSTNWTTSSWLSTSSAYCSYVCVLNTTSALPNTTTVHVESIVPVAYADYYIGVILAIAQTFFGGFSFLFKKVGQNRTGADERKRAAKRLAASSRNLRASTTSLRNNAHADDRTGSGGAAPAGDSGGASGGATEAGGNADEAREAAAAKGPSTINFRYLLDYVWWLGMIFSARASNCSSH